jgi:hypothetical protein
MHFSPSILGTQFICFINVWSTKTRGGKQHQQNGRPTDYIGVVRQPHTEIMHIA